MKQVIYFLEMLFATGMRALKTSIASMFILAGNWMTANAQTISLSDNTAVTAASVAQGMTNWMLHRSKLELTGSVFAVTDLACTTTGTYGASDIVNLKLYYSSTSSFTVGNSTLLSTITNPGVAGLKTFTSLVPVYPNVVNNQTGKVTGYYFITADFSNTAATTKTIAVSALAPANFTLTSGILSGSTAAGGAQTIADGVLANNGTQIINTTVAAGAINWTLHKSSISCGSTARTLMGMTCTTGGNYLLNEITSLKVYYSPYDAFAASTATLLSTITTPTTAGAKTFPSFTSQLIPANTVGYIYIVADVASGLANGRTISISALTTANFTFTPGALPAGSTTAGGTQTTGTVTATLSDNSPQVTTSSVAQGATNVLLHKSQLFFSGGTTRWVAWAVSTAGNYTASDILNIKVYTSSSSTFGTGLNLMAVFNNPGAARAMYLPQNGFTQSNSGTTYIYITADIAPGATVGNTISANAISNIITDGGNGTTAGSTTDGAAKTIIANPTPTITLSNNGTQVVAANVGQGANNVVLHKSQILSTAGYATVSGLNCTTGGTYGASDVTSLKLYYSSSNTFALTTATLISTLASPGAGGGKTFPSFTQYILAGTTGYFYIAADIATSATVGASISVSGLTTGDFTVGAGTFSGSTTGGGAQTVVATSFITLADNSPQVTAGSAVLGTTHHLCYKVALTITNTNATLTGMTCNVGGNATSQAFSNLRVYYSTSSTFSLGTSTLLSTLASISNGVVTFPSFTSQPLTNGTTGYLYFTAQVNSLISGRTIAINALTPSDLTIPLSSISGSTANGGIQSVVHAALSDNAPQSAAASVPAGTNNVVLHQSIITNGSSAFNLTGMTCTTAGNYLSADVTNLKVWYQTTPTFTGAGTVLSTFLTPGTAGSKTFPSFISQALPTSANSYIFITVDVTAGATLGRTINVNALATTNFTIASATTGGSTTIGGTKTFAAPLCTQPTTLAAIGAYTDNTTGTTLTVNWTRGSGDSVIVVGRLNTTTGADPVLGTTYTDNSAFGSGTGSEITGAGNYVLYLGTGTSVGVTGLTEATNYTFTVYEFNTSGRCYKTPGSSSTIATPCTQPTTQAAIGAFTNNTSGTSVTANWTRGNGNAGVIVVARLTTTTNVEPAIGGTYTANAAFGSGTGSQITGAGNYVVYVGTGTSTTISGLAGSTNYTVLVYEYNSGPCYATPGSSDAFSTPVAYCTPSYSLNCGFSFLDAVSIGTSGSILNQAATGCVGALADYTGITVNLTQGGSYPFSITTTGGGVDNLGIWIDFNNDGDFLDTDEFLGNFIEASNVWTGNIIIPGGVTTGNHRMRIRGSLGTAFTGSSTSCENVNRGETHDYTVNISTACTQPTSQATIGAYTNNNTGTSLTVNWTRGSGDGVIVVGRLTATTAVEPISGGTYSVTSFGSGSGNQLTGTGNYVLYVGTGTTVAVSGLTALTNYTFSVYEYSNTAVCYKTPGSSSAVATPVTCNTPALNISITHVSCFGGSNGAVTLSPTGGTAPFTYSWSNGATTQSINGLFPGTYSVTVTATGGCTTSSGVQTVTQPAAALSGSITSQTNVACFGNSTGSVTIQAANGTSPYKYDIGAGYGAPTAGSNTFNGLAAGTYSVTILDASNTCTAIVPITITQPSAALNGTISAQTNVDCFGNSTGSVTVNGLNGTSPYEYALDAGAFSPANTFSGLVAGTYTVTVKDVNLCTKPVTVVIFQPSLLNGTISSQTNVACNGDNTGSVTVNGSNGTAPYQYALDAGTYSVVNTFSGLAVGSYIVTVRDANLCTTPVIVIITQPAAAINGAISSQTDVLCYGNSTGIVTVAGSDGTSPYLYSLDAGTYSVTNTFSNLAAGTYTVTVKDANLCTQPVTVIIMQPLVVLSGSIVTQSNILCFQDPNTGSIEIQATGGISPYQYKLGNGPYGSATAGSNTFTSLAEGTYTVTISDANSCTTTVTSVITRPVAPLAASPTYNNPVCDDSPLILSANTSGGSGGNIYSWSGPNGTIAPVSNPTITTLAGSSDAGSYSVTVTDQNGCVSAPSSVNVIVHVLPNVNMSITGTNPVCIGSSTTIGVFIVGEGNITGTLSDGTPFSGFIDPLDGFVSIDNIIVYPTATTTYQVATLHDGFCDADPSILSDPINAVEIIVNPSPSSPDITVTGSACGSSTLTASNYTESLIWSTNETTSSITVTVAGTYSVQQVSNSTGCLSIPTVASANLGNCSSLSAKLFIQGYYRNIGSSTPMDNFGAGGCLKVTGGSANTSDVDYVTVHVMNSISPYAEVTSATGILQTDGSLSVTFSPALSGNYYLKVTHRNSVETWSKNPVALGYINTYDFSNAANKAYGDNQVEVETGVWAIYSGDISNTITLGSQDGVIESSDYSDEENAVNLGLTGYIVSDITGDGSVTTADYSLMQTNVYYTVISINP